MPEPLPAQPSRYYVAITRSDGRSLRVFIDGACRRIEHYDEGQLTRVVISRPDLREIHCFHVLAREHSVSPLPPNFDPSHLDPYKHADAELLEIEPALGISCKKFAVSTAPNHREHQWRAVDTGLQMRSQTFHADGRPALTTLTTEHYVGPMPEKAFDLAIRYTAFPAPAG